MSRTNYLNNRDMLKEIHASKNSYCVFADPKQDHQFDIIVHSVADVTKRKNISQARTNRIERVRRETGTEVAPRSIPVTDLVFRVMTWEHIPLAPKKIPKSAAKKRRLEDILDLDDVEETTEDIVNRMDAIESGLQDPTHIRVNFPPFFHYRINEHRIPYVVGKSHWQGDLDAGVFSREHGAMTRKLAMMFMKLCERYATRSNWRGYTYNEEMRGQALLQLSQIGLQFDESKSQNPFAYYTAAITNSFTRILNIEKKNQNIRDDILEMNGLNPSWTRQNSGSKSMAAMSGPVVTTYEE